MSRRIQLATDYWQNLGELSVRHKLLYHLIYLAADHAGVVSRSLRDLSASAGDEFSASDVRALGGLVVRLDDARLLVPGYLREQWGTLSRDCRAQVPMWQALRTHWGAGEEGAEEPFIAAWRALGLEKHLPPFVDHYLGSGPKPRWLVEHERAAIGAMSVVAPSEWGEDLRREFRYWVEMRRDLAMRATSRHHTEHSAFSLRLARQAIDTINGWLAKGIAERRICDSLMASCHGSYTSFRRPKG